MFRKIAFIGAGSMAKAIIAGIIHQEVLKSDHIYVTNKSDTERLNMLADQYKVHCTQNKHEVINEADIIILSVKPVDLKEAMQSIQPFIKPHQLIISVVAGISTTFISSFLKDDVPVIRAMPNTSASIGYSATALSAGHHTSKQHILMSESLFNSIGTTTVVAEDHMDLITGISGSGPAYIYYLAEAMERVAIEEGLKQDVAKSLITQTILGAGEMLKQSKESTKVLRKNITSPAGTTEAGINTLNEHHFQKAVIECVKSAKKRSIELRKLYEK